MNILSTTKVVTQDVSTDIGEFRITRKNDGIAFVEQLDPNGSGRYFFLGEKQKVSTDDHNQLVRMAWEL